MRALVLKKPGEAAVEIVPDPVRRPDQVLLKVRNVGLCGTDLNSFRGKNPLITYPRVLGHEIAATVVETSGLRPDLAEGACVAVSPYSSCGSCPSCRRSRPNACQFCQTMGVMRDGGLTEFIQAPAEDIFPAKLSLSELCIVEPLSIGFHAAARGRVTAEDTVAVIGCGGVGLGAIAGASFRGARVIAIDVEADKLDVAYKAGAAYLINTASEPLGERLRELTAGSGPDVVIEAVGRPETFRAAVELVAFSGRVVYIGYAKEDVAYETRLFVQKELEILGSRNAIADNFREVIRMLEDKRFPVADYITEVVPLDAAAEMLRRWSDHPGDFTKIIVRLE
jgi:threonine dehydrogenase-like Zn-dependent dehydrogenase